MNVRLAENKDIEMMSGVLADSWKSAYRGIVNDEYLDTLSREHWVGFLTEGFHREEIFAMVLEESEHIIGVAVLGVESRNTASLISFYLLPDKIGHGLGHIFYREIESELSSRGFTKCTLDVLAQNDRAILFYETHGFSFTGKMLTTNLGKGEYFCKVYEKQLLSQPDY